MSCSKDKENNDLTKQGLSSDIRKIDEFEYEGDAYVNEGFLYKNMKSHTKYIYSDKGMLIEKNVMSSVIHSEAADSYVYS